MSVPSSIIHEDITRSAASRNVSIIFARRIVTNWEPTQVWACADFVAQASGPTPSSSVNSERKEDDDNVQVKELNAQDENGRVRIKHCTALY